MTIFSCAFRRADSFWSALLLPKGKWRTPSQATKRGCQRCQMLVESFPWLLSVFWWIIFLWCCPRSSLYPLRLPCCFLLGNRMILIIYQIYLFKQYHIFITIIPFIFRSILMYCKHVSAWLIQRYAWNKRTTSWCFLLQKYAFRSLIFFDFFRRQGECGCPDNVYLPTFWIFQIDNFQDFELI